MSESTRQTTEIQPAVLPVIALRGINVFPNTLLHFDVGRRASVRALDKALDEDSRIFLVAQKELTTEHPELEDLYSIGTVCEIRQVMRASEDSVRVLVEGQCRGRLLSLTRERPYLEGEVESVEELTLEDPLQRELYLRECVQLVGEYCEVNPKAGGELVLQAATARDPVRLADYLAENILFRLEEKQSVLETIDPKERIDHVLELLKHELELLRLQQRVESKTQEGLEQAKRDYYLREQLRVIQEELGEGGQIMDDFGLYQKRISELKAPKAVREKLEEELNKLRKQPFGSQEGAVLREYLDISLALPWGIKTKERLNVQGARKVLDADHYGMEKVKERILEFVAVRRLAPDLKGQIICLVGPPGVGKTSIASSVAKALNRKMARVSLGGVHDEAEIRGHRKTYVGSMPGRIVDAVKRAGSMNPLILLDEVDKLGSDYRGDPASALLEVLDAEQNTTFRDNYLDFELDLSDVMFLTTANDLSTVPPALLDRMEVIELGSYTDEEKVQIARRHLLPKQMKRHGLDGRRFRVTDDALREIISGYTRESGVRVLERRLAELCRKGAMSEVTGEQSGRITVTGDNLEQYLGVRKYHPEKLSRTPEVGLVNGLAWTSVGGVLLQVEVNVCPGSGKVELTGNLGNVMKESCYAAVSYIRAHAEELGISQDFYQKKDIHVHFPEGAVPKDGPSAGVTITTALVSALTGAPVRQDVAMTGEVTLRGRVLPIGGLKEKTMAAFRNGIHLVLIPAENEKDLEEIDQTVRQALQFQMASQVGEVLKTALLPVPQPKQKKAVLVPGLTQQEQRQTRESVLQQ